ncbi:hypothetical protein [Sulfitobacter donghicola]|nr:hypothetical protein [Sulfitobacter donghicola]
MIPSFRILCVTTFALAQSAHAENTNPLKDEFTSSTFGAPKFTYSAGVLATTRLNPSDSLDHVEDELELFYEIGFGGGFHAGITLTTLDGDPADNYEYEITFGYGSEFANGMTWDLTYGYIGLDNSDETSEEITATLGFPLGETIEGSFAVIVDPDTGKSDQEFGLETALNDRWTLFGLAGNSDRDDNVYGEVGVSYALTDSVALEVLYEDTNDDDPLLGFTIGYEFGG